MQNEVVLVRMANMLEIDVSLVWLQVLLCGICTFAAACIKSVMSWIRGVPAATDQVSESGTGCQRKQCYFVKRVQAGSDIKRWWIQARVSLSVSLKVGYVYKTYC